MKNTSELTPLLSRYVDSMNAHDSALFVTCFAADAVVEDEEHTHRGPTEIKTWIEAAFVKYRPQFEVREIGATESGVALTGLVSGTFDGSPAMLKHEFEAFAAGDFEAVGIEAELAEEGRVDVGDVVGVFDGVE
eukprot:gene19550-23953_t